MFFVFCRQLGTLFFGITIIQQKPSIRVLWAMILIEVRKLRLDDNAIFLQGFCCKSPCPSFGPIIHQLVQLNAVLYSMCILCPRPNIGNGKGQDPNITNDNYSLFFIRYFESYCIIIWSVCVSV